MNKKNIIIYFLVILYPLGLDLYLVATPEISNHLQVKENETGWFFAIYLIGVAFSLIIAGKCSDLYGSRYVCILGCLIYLLASLICTYIPLGKLNFFLTARFFQGFGGGVSYIIAQSLVRKIYPTKDLRIKAYSKLNGISCTVPIIAPSLGALLIISGWQMIFLFTSFISMILLILSYCLINNKFNLMKKEKKKEKEKYLSLNFITMAIVSSISLSCVFFYVSSSPVILINKLNIKNDTYGILMGLFSLFSVCTALLLPQLRKLFSDFSLLRISISMMFITGVIGIFLTDFEDLKKYIIIFSIIGIINAIIFSITLGYALEPFENNSGEAAGILHTIQLIFTGICILLTSKIDIYAGDLLVYFLTLGALISFVTIQYHRYFFEKNGDYNEVIIKWF